MFTTHPCVVEEYPPWVREVACSIPDRVQPNFSNGFLFDYCTFVKRDFQYFAKILSKSTAVNLFLCGKVLTF